jgi:uncharacterized HAD superfamily protein
MSRKRIGIDIDGTLCVGQHWETPDEILKAKPIPYIIKKVEKLYKNNFIVIYTARQNWAMSATFEWLDRNNVKYHAVMNKKCPLDAMMDDISI